MKFSFNYVNDGMVLALGAMIALVRDGLKKGGTRERTLNTKVLSKLSPSSIFMECLTQVLFRYSGKYWQRHQERHKEDSMDKAPLHSLPS